MLTYTLAVGSLLAAMLLAAPVVQAQSTLSVGPCVGLNLFTFHYSDSFGFDTEAHSDYRPGFVGGYKRV